MHDAIYHLLKHGGLIVWAAVFVEQLGLPLPAFPWLMAAGALAFEARFNPFLAVGLAVSACLAADMFWFTLGKRAGSPVLNLLCWFAPDPESCVCRTQSVFRRFGMRAVVAAKFLPGASTVIPALAAKSKVSGVRFFFYDTIGASFYAGLYVALGIIFHAQVERVGNAFLSLGRGAFVFIAGLGIIYFGIRFFRRRKVAHKLNATQIVEGPPSKSEPLICLHPVADSPVASQIEKT